MKFKDIEISDRQIFDRYLNNCNEIGSQFSFVTNFIWQRGYNIQYTTLGDFLFIRGAANGVQHYSSPIGKGDKEEAFRKIIEFSHGEGQKCVFINLSNQDAQFFQNKTDNFNVIFSDDYSDYIYLTEKLIKLSGKNLHAKKNHFNRFVKENNFSFDMITNKNIEKAYDFVLRHSENKGEKNAADGLFLNYNDLPVKGAIIEIDSKVIAATVGERLNEKTALIHIEKAERSINGAYTAVNKMFLESAFPDTVYVNREEDMGIEGLRRAKQSYHPEFLLTKCRAEEQ